MAKEKAVTIAIWSVLPVDFKQGSDRLDDL